MMGNGNARLDPPRESPAGVALLPVGLTGRRWPGNTGRQGMSQDPSADFTRAVETIIMRLEDEPLRILFQKEPDWPEGLDFLNLNILAQAAGFHWRYLIESEILPDQTRLVHFHPPDESRPTMTWRVWDCSGADDRGATQPGSPKLARTVEYLRAWIAPKNGRADTKTDTPKKAPDDPAAVSKPAFSNYPFGVAIDPTNRTASRGEKKVEFGGHTQPWKIFLMLLRRHPNRFAVADLLKAGWDGQPGQKAVNQTITTIRSLIRPLGLRIDTVRAIGFLLQELPIPAATNNQPTPRKRAASRRR
ncbi:hypothetical protein AYO44_03755 [Planctomycetaceae bacterium SCGC AG-212-F19]|nr:hypothetical protein AYO44_03755 [Planctomycetaceae bacterium SCGC AG-212-F19]